MWLEPEPNDSNSIATESKLERRILQINRKTSTTFLIKRGHKKL